MKHAVRQYLSVCLLLAGVVTLVVTSLISPKRPALSVLLTNERVEVACILLQTQLNASRTMLQKRAGVVQQWEDYAR